MLHLLAAIWTFCVFFRCCRRRRRRYCCCCYWLVGWILFFLVFRLSIFARIAAIAVATVTYHSRGCFCCRRRRRSYEYVQHSSILCDFLFDGGYIGATLTLSILLLSSTASLFRVFMYNFSLFCADTNMENCMKFIPLKMYVKRSYESGLAWVFRRSFPLALARSAFFYSTLFYSVFYATPISLCVSLSFLCIYHIPFCCFLTCFQVFLLPFCSFVRCMFVRVRACVCMLFHAVHRIFRFLSTFISQ